MNTEVNHRLHRWHRYPIPGLESVLSVTSVVKKVWGRGGLGRMHELFGERLDALIEEPNKLNHRLHRWHRYPIPGLESVLSVTSVVKKVWARGGLGRMHELFGDRLDALIEELNKELTA